MIFGRRGLFGCLLSYDSLFLGYLSLYGLTLMLRIRFFSLLYGIKIYRRRMGLDYTPYMITDEMSVYDPDAGTEADPRWAVQIPYKVRQAGLAANPRNKK